VPVTAPLPPYSSPAAPLSFSSSMSTAPMSYSSPTVVTPLSFNSPIVSAASYSSPAPVMAPSSKFSFSPLARPILSPSIGPLGMSSPLGGAPAFAFSSPSATRPLNGTSSLGPLGLSSPLGGAPLSFSSPSAIRPLTGTGTSAAIDSAEPFSPAAKALRLAKAAPRSPSNANAHIDTQLEALQTQLKQFKAKQQRLQEQLMQTHGHA
jgi:hypothetical protein